MNIQSLLSKFSKTASYHKKIVVIVQPDGLYFAGKHLAQLPQYVELSSPWQDVLVETLQSADVKESVLDVVLHSSFYQTYQIERPNIPETEWESALPFLLKDLTSEKVSDIVAQAFPLPYGNRIQCYVVNKPLIVQLAIKLAEMHIQLGKVLIEDDVWPLVDDVPNSFLLLQKSKQSQYKVSALVSGSCVFQRTIRGVTSPLVGGATSSLQLDSIALELQRSVDYLSSQLKGTHIHQMKVCCDGEDSALLANELTQRLNVNVSPLSSHQELCGHILAVAASQGKPTHIDLYLESLKPKKEHLGLQTVLAGWGIVALSLFAAWGWLVFEQQGLKRQAAALSSQQQTLDDQSKQLKLQLAQHKPSADKLAAVERIKAEIEAQKSALNSLQNYELQDHAGFSGVMSALANINRTDIALNYIKVEGQYFDLKGLAKTPQAVPSWIKQFKQELDLVGRAFDKLTIGRNDQQVITFELNTKRESN